jgi:2-polyprenyl-3-methyl-5-hydroxy-6-metoxy-1,4-benzoquinol methylase
MTDAAVAREVACPVCPPGTAQRDVTVRWGVRIVACTGCGLVFANPQPSEEELERYYGPEYFQRDEAKFLRWPLERDVELRFGRYLAELRAVCPGGSVLDVGCGTGMFLRVCREAGYETRGVELSPYASALGRERLGLAIDTGRLEELDGSRRFDAVTMWDFLEHTSEPLAILRAAERVLAGGGHLLLTVPNVGSWWARCMGPRWVGFDKASEHLFYFTRESLRGMLARAGFVPVKVRPHAWVCTAAFLADRGAKAWRGGGRLLGSALRGLRLEGSVVRFPSVNLLAVARKGEVRSG